MEEEIIIKKKNRTLPVVIGIVIGLSVSIIGILVYNFVLNKSNVNSNESRTQIPIKHETETTEDKNVVLNEEDVKQWLESNNGILDLYYIKSEQDFDNSNITKEGYSDFLGNSLLFGGLAQNNSVESITLNSGDYNYQYSYPIGFVKSLLNNYFNVGLEMIDLNAMNSNYKGVANFAMDKNLFTIKVIATGLDNYNSSKLNKISLNEDNNIVVNYILEDCMVEGTPDNCKNIGTRELLLKKTSTGYNLLKAYKVD